jgi:3-hydroxyisobutyrate dehydrogenase
MQTIAFVGLGAMGQPMTRALLAGGITVRGTDVRQAALDALAAAGGIACHTAAAAATGADALLLMVVDAAQAEAVLFAGGALNALPPHGIVVLMATCPPAVVAAIADRVLATGRRFVDAPVSGGVAGATAAKLTIMAAAPDDVFAAIRPVFAALGQRIFHVGDKPGQGAVVKTVNQLLCGAHIVVAAEGLALAEKLGVDGRMLLAVMGGSSAAS